MLVKTRVLRKGWVGGRMVSWGLLVSSFCFNRPRKGFDRKREKAGGRWLGNIFLLG